LGLRVVEEALEGESAGREVAGGRLVRIRALAGSGLITGSAAGAARLQHTPGRVVRHLQLILAAWGDTTSGFFASWFACSGSTNHGFYCDPKLDRLMRRAQLSQGHPYWGVIVDQLWLR
jgi:hypothetical protein